MRVNRHTAWLKHELMEDFIEPEALKAYKAKHELWDQEPFPKFEKYRHDIYYRSRKALYIWHISKPTVKLYWPFKWPIKVRFNIIKTRHSR